MRNRFTEWISQGIASFKRVKTIQETPEQDPICRLYNNLFGMVSDTHMSCTEEGYRVITGHIINTENWDKFLYAPQWGGVPMKEPNVNKPSWWSLCGFLSKLKLRGQVETLNGDIVYKIYPCEDSEDCCGTPLCQDCCVTSESKIPRPIAMISTTGSKLHVLECYAKSNNKNEVANKLNESLNIKGNNWFAYNDKIYGLIGDTVYII